ncbi:DUF1254 domain-containing protein [Tardiphaga sp. 803_E3_N1_3]|uniref:DUF1254 domain-containing protein n=1 Tax=unclassified Tardiphaga TaxID=2631404 RepID=UPI003F25C999
MKIDDSNTTKMRDNFSNDRTTVGRRDLLLGGSCALAASTLIGEALVHATPAQAQTLAALPSDEISEVAISAYIYAYPLILMEITRRVSTNVADASHFGKAPMNQFGHLPAFPDATFTDVVRPNADTLYSLMWFDVSEAPLLIGVPDSGGRYYLLPMLDMWTDVFESTGSRTTGTSAQYLRITGPDWRGDVHPEAISIRSPTAIGWIIGRTQTNGKADYDAVHKFQAGLVATQPGRFATQPPSKINPDWDMKTPPTEQVEKMTPAAYFSLFAELARTNPPHANDYPILDQMRRIGIEPGKPFDFKSASPEVQRALSDAGPAATKKIKAQFLRAGMAHAGWRTNLSAVGTYGADYLSRAGVAFAGLGANTIEDAVYPTALTDADGKPFSSDNRYVLHFEKNLLPAVRGFWSLTMYNEKQAFAANPIDRYAIGDRDKLSFNPDGSLDLYIQRETPGKEKEANWLPAPASGPFTMNMRLYWPKPEVLDGSWQPPGVKRV